MATNRKPAHVERIIFHIDVNSAFLSWSAVKRLREDPGSVDLRTVPAVVGGDPATRHGIVTAKSLPAKKYGIHTAEPIAQAMGKCPHLIVIPSDFTTYRACSQAFMDILKTYTPLVEQASIDEAYMDVTRLVAEAGPARAKAQNTNRGRRPCLPAGCAIKEAGSDILMDSRQDAGQDARAATPGQDARAATSGQDARAAALDLAAQIRARIRDELGFTVNVGISTNRLLAKMASDFQKPDRTHTLYPEEVPAKLWPLPIGDLHGCGRKTSARLRTLDIRTIGEAADTPAEVLISHLGDKAGRYIHDAANGIAADAVSPVREDAKSYSNEWTTSSDITADTYEGDYLPLLRYLCEKIAGRLQRDGVYGKTVFIAVKTDDFRRRSAQRALPDPSNRAEDIYEAASALSDRLLLGEKGLFSEGAAIRLVGAGVTDLDDGTYRQMNLQDWMAALPADAPRAGQKQRTIPPQQEKNNFRSDRSRNLEAMEEAIRRRYGKDAIKKAREIL